MALAQITPNQQLRRVSIIKVLMTRYKAPEIKDILEKEYNILCDSSTINRDIIDINEGRYNTFLDNLLDFHLPKMYEDAIALVNEDLKTLDGMASNEDFGKRERVICRINHAKIALDLIETIHKAPVLREMKRLATRSKELARMSMQVSTKRLNEAEAPEETDRKIITLNEELEEIKEDIEKDIKK